MGLTCTPTVIFPLSLSVFIKSLLPLRNFEKNPKLEQKLKNLDIWDKEVDKLPQSSSSIQLPGIRHSCPTIPQDA